MEELFEGGSTCLSRKHFRHWWLDCRRGVFRWRVLIFLSKLHPSLPYHLSIVNFKLFNLGFWFFTKLFEGIFGVIFQESIKIEIEALFKIFIFQLLLFVRPSVFLLIFQVFNARPQVLEISFMAVEFVIRAFLLALLSPCWQWISQLL